MSSKTPMELLKDAHDQVRKAIKAIEEKLNTLPCGKCSLDIAHDNNDPHFGSKTSLEWRMADGRSKRFRFFINNHGVGVDSPLTQADAETMFLVVEMDNDRDSFLQKIDHADPRSAGVDRQIETVQQCQGLLQRRTGKVVRCLI